MYSIVTLLIGFNFSIEPIVLPAGRELLNYFERVKSFSNTTNCNVFDVKCSELANNQCLMNNLCFSSNNSYINETLYDPQNIGGVALMNLEGYSAITMSTIITLFLTISLFFVGGYKVFLGKNSCERKNKNKCQLKCTCFQREFSFPMFLHINIFFIGLIIFLFTIPSLKWMNAEKEQKWTITSDRFLNTRFSSRGFKSPCKNNLYIIDSEQNVSNQCYEIDEFGDEICCISNLVEFNDDAKKLYNIVVEYTKDVDKFSFSAILAVEFTLLCIFLIPFIIDIGFFVLELYKAYQDRVIEPHIYYNAMDDNGVELQTFQV